MTKADLSVIADATVRWRADEDFHIVQQCRENARFFARHKLPGWRLDHRLELRRAIRHWRYYKLAIRSAKQ